MIRFELYVCNSYTLRYFRHIGEVHEYCRKTLTEVLYYEAYIYNENNEVICNLHGTRTECLRQLENNNLDFN